MTGPRRGPRALGPAIGAVGLLAVLWWAHSTGSPSARLAVLVAAWFAVTALLGVGLRSVRALRPVAGLLLLALVIAALFTTPAHHVAEVFVKMAALYLGGEFAMVIIEHRGTAGPPR